MIQRRMSRIVLDARRSNDSEPVGLGPAIFVMIVVSLKRIGNWFRRCPAQSIAESNELDEQVLVSIGDCK